MQFMNCALNGLAMMAAMRSASAFTSSPALRRQVAKTAAYYSSTSSLKSSNKMDQSFPTWSFDKPCLAMEWNELIPATIATSTDMSTTSDLVLVGIYGPPESDDDDKDDEPAPSVVLTGAAKDMDEALGGMLSEVINDNAKTFKSGAKAGATTPTIRVAGNGSGKVRYKCESTSCFICPSFVVVYTGL
jgi:hypothetical protein